MGGVRLYLFPKKFILCVLGHLSHWTQTARIGIDCILADDVEKGRLA
jgi:hypothetical protein